MIFGLSLVAYFVVGYLFITIGSVNAPFTDGEAYFLAILFWPFVAIVMLCQTVHRFVIKFGRWLHGKVK